jgi:hypothetical protein
MIEFPLSYTNRCSKAVVELAKKYSPNIKAKENAQDGKVIECLPSEMLQIVSAKDFILARTKAILVDTALTLIKLQKPCIILGKDIGSKCDMILFKAMKLFNITSKEPDAISRLYAALCNKENCRLLMQETEGDTVNLIDAEDDINILKALLENSQKIEDIYVILNKLFSDNIEEKIILATIHKSKGLEADRVFVMQDKLPHPRVYKTLNEDLIEQETINLPYVAYTRAIRNVYIVKKKVEDEDEDTLED